MRPPRDAANRVAGAAPVRRSGWPRLVLPWVAAWLVGAGPAAAQEVEFRPGSGGLPAADALVRRVLARGEYRVISADRVLAASEAIEGDVIVLGATLRVEGRIGGDLVGVQSDIFARPGGAVEGTVVVLGGGFYGSTLARLGDRPVSASGYAYTFDRRRDGRYVIAAPGGRARLRLAGLYGLLTPGYDRVNALTVPLGLDFERGGIAALPNAEVRFRVRTARELFDGGLTLRWRSGPHEIFVAGGRTVRTNDDWINGNLESSIYSFIGAIDTRNYYDADFVDIGLRLGFGSRGAWRAGVDLGWERGRPLANQDPFSLFDARGGGFQPNLPALAADAASLRLSGAVETAELGDAGLRLDAEVELADASLAGDLTFALAGGGARLRIPTRAGQTLMVEGRVQFPLSDEAPPQRWRGLGGWGSLPTLVPTGQAGDHLWWAATTYRIPLTRRLRRVGAPLLWVQYAGGNAWTATARPRTVHDIGLGVTLGPLALAVYTAPGDDFKTVLILGLDTRR